MILQWTSSVNNLTLPTAGLVQSAYDDTFSYEDVMKYHVWNLYSELTSSGWVPVSSSYSSSTGYFNGQSWPSINNLSFPEKMADSLTKNDLYNEKDMVYTPSEHCWVTLKKVFSASEIYYLTVDCRYPLPPHVSNTGIIVNKLINPDASILYQEIDNSNEKKLFIGPTSIEKMSEAILSDSTPYGPVWPNTQEINSLDGVCMRDDTSRKFNMTPTAVAIPYGQDYISRCVSFIDISILRASYSNDSEIARVTEADGLNYISSTTRVRPKRDKDDQNAWYICWGFDFLDDSTKSIKDKIALTSYKYAFHKDENGHFIYQIYKVGDTSFRSGFAFLPVQNKVGNDLTSKISFCVNCDPSNVYNINSINFNTLGTEVALISGSNDTTFKTNITTQLDSFKNNKTTINNFFNTCFRNYNFSDGKSTIKAGIGGNIGQYMQLPIYAPTKPKDATLFVHSASYVSSEKITPTSLMPYGVNITYAKKFTAATENSFFELPCKEFSSHVINKRQNGKYIVKIPRALAFTKAYPVYIQDGVGDNKRILINKDGSAFTLTLNSISALAGVSAADLVGNPFYLSGPADIFSSISSLFKDLYFTVDSNKSSIVKPSDFISAFDPKTFENTKGSLRIYVGSRAGSNWIPRAFTGQRLWASAANTIINNAIVLNEAVGSIQSLYQDDPGKINTTNGKDYLAYTAAEMASALKATGRRLPGFDASSEIVTRCYIDVPITDIYNLNACTYVDEAGSPLAEIASGDFDYNKPGAGSVPVDQHKGSNFFSVFKSSYFGEQQPLAGAIYSFSNDTKSVSNASVFGTINLDGSSNNKFIANKDANNSYPELPIFLFSLSTKNIIKGYVPDITWSPYGVNEASVVADISPGATKNYKKVYWGGCWFPWVSDHAPDL